MSRRMTLVMVSMMMLMAAVALCQAQGGLEPAAMGATIAPEPLTAAILGAGALVLFSRRKRK